MLVILHAQSFGQQYFQVIKGQVRDSESQHPLVGAIVSMTSVNPVLYATCDERGNFRIENVAVGRHSIKISHVGYQEMFFQEMLVGSGKEVDVQVNLIESFKTLDEVVVLGRKKDNTPVNDMISASARSFNVDQSKRFAAAVNDPSRVVLSFAGVSTNDDSNNQIIVRGNSPKGVLWRMEGVEIPNPNHFGRDGASGGAISALSVNVLATSDFLTGAFPAEYGNAISGAFDLRMRKGNSEKREYAMQAGLLGLDFSAEGPMNKNTGASYLANYRYSTLTILSKLGIKIVDDSGTSFQDGAFKISMPLSKNKVISVWGIGGLSTSNLDKAEFRENFKSNRLMSGINLQKHINDRSHTETILSYSATRQISNRNEKLNLSSSFEEYINQAVKASVQYNNKLNSRNAIRTGLIVTTLIFNLKDQQNEDQLQKINLDQSIASLIAQPYLQWKSRLSPTLTTNMGVHGLFFHVNGRYSIEPRFGLRWMATRKSTISLAGGLHSKTESLSTYFAQVNTGQATTALVNKNLKLMKSAHIVAGYEFSASDSWRIHTESYYQHHYHVPIGPARTTTSFLLQNSLLNELDGYSVDSLSSQGRGRSYGIELTVEKLLNDGLYALLTTSLYQAKYTGRDGIERDSRFNGKFVQNLLIGKEWKFGKSKTNIFAINLKELWSGGNRTTPINLERSRIEKKTIRDWSQAYSNPLPNYFRMDFRVSYTKNKSKTTATISLDVQNITNRLNAYDTYFDSVGNKPGLITQTGILPVVNYRLEF